MIIGEWSIVNRKGSVVYVVNGCRCTAFILERSSETDEDTKDIAVDVRFARLIPSIGVRKWLDRKNLNLKYYESDI